MPTAADLQESFANVVNEIVILQASHDRLLGACRLIAGKDYDEPAGRIAVLAAEEAIKQAPPKIAEKSS